MPPRLVAGLLTSCLLVAAACGPRSPHPREVAWPGVDPWVLPTERCRDFFVVDAHINGTGPWRLLLDSGTAETLLDPSVYAAVGRRGIDSLRIDAFVARRLSAAEQEMTQLSQALGMGLDGIVGHPVFAAGTLTYDYPEGEVRLSRQRLGPDADPIATRMRRRPLVPARVGHHGIWVLIDTGSSQGLTLTDVHRFDLAEGPVPTGARVRVDGLHTLRSARLAGSATVGPLLLDRPVVHESPRLELVGTRVLRHFAVSFDQRSGRVAFARPDAPVGDPLPPETEWSLGMALQPGATGHEVVAVFAGSPAARAGIRAGDRIVATDGRALDEERCEAAPVVLPPPAEVHVEVERDGVRRTVTLVPAPAVGY